MNRARPHRPPPASPTRPVSATQAGGSPTPGRLLRVQQSVGNRSMLGLVLARMFPDRFTRPGDEVELDAEQRAEARPADAAGLSDSGELPGALGSGRPLEPAVRESLESRFGQGLGDVRIHSDGAAADSARGLHARAYTVGSHVVFGRGEYAPGSPAGRSLLTHEIAHASQGDGGVIARAVTDQYPTIEKNLTYGILDWAITDREAREVLEILAPLGPQDLEDTVKKMEADGLLDRLLENVSEADRRTYASLLESIQRLRSNPDIERHITELMSYGVLDWVITDAEAHVALEALKSLRSDPPRLLIVVAAIPARQWERFYDNLSDEDRRENLRFLQELELMRSSGRTLTELGTAQRVHLEAEAAARGETVGEHIRGEATSRGYGGYTATWWPSLTPEERQRWRDDFDEVVRRIRADAPREVRRVIEAAESAGGGIQFLPQEVEELGPTAYAFRSGNVLGVGKSWVETAKQNPANVYENIIHELGGHLEYGPTVSWDIMQGTLSELPASERAIAESGPRHLYSAYQYMETEIYAELRELPYRTEGSQGDDPATNVEEELRDLQDAFEPSIAEAIVRSFRRRIQIDERISGRARRLFDEKVKVVFGIEF